MKTLLSNIGPVMTYHVIKDLDSNKSLASFRLALERNYDHFFMHSWNWETQLFEQLEDRKDEIAKEFPMEWSLRQNLRKIRNIKEFRAKCEHNIYLF